jgi:hypothetical protein
MEPQPSRRFEDDRRVQRLSERWFASMLGWGEAQGRLEAVLYSLSGDSHLDGPRLVDPAGPFARYRRTPDFAASMITGRMDASLPSATDAHIEVRLYDEGDICTLYVGIAALACRRPERTEQRLLADFARLWRRSGDTSLVTIERCDYAI